MCPKNAQSHLKVIPEPFKSHPSHIKFRALLVPQGGSELQTITSDDLFGIKSFPEKNMLKVKKKLPERGPSPPSFLSFLDFLATSALDLDRAFLLSPELGVLANFASSVPVISTPSSVNSFFSLETLRPLLAGSVVLGVIGLLVLESKKIYYKIICFGGIFSTMYAL